MTLIEALFYLLFFALGFIIAWQLRGDIAQDEIKQSYQKGWLSGFKGKEPYQ